MAGMEKQLSEFQAREDGISTLSKDCQQKVEEHILQRDQANVKYNTLRKEVARLLDERKALVEEKAHENENVVDAVESKYSLVISGKDSEIHELVVANAKLKSEAERCGREKRNAEQIYLKLKNVLDGERAALQGSFAATGRRIFEAESRAELEGSQHKLCGQQLKELQLELEKKEISSGDLRGKLEKLALKNQNEYDALAKSLRDAEDVVEGKKFELDKMNVMVAEAKNTATHRMTEALKKVEMELQDARLAAEGARSHSRDRESAMQEQVESARGVAERARKDKEMMMEQLEKKLSEEREVGSRMTTRNQELGVRVNMLAVEKAELNVIAAEAEAKLEDAESALEQTEGQVEELSVQLSAHVGDQERRIKEEVQGGGGLERVRKEQIVNLTGGHNTPWEEQERAFLSNFLVDREDV